MARLFWLLVMLALVAAVMAGASWAMAYNSVGTLLGAPPPKMGSQSTQLVWHGMPPQEKHPFVWRFAFGPTVIPGATRVAIYVGPTGEVIRTEPSDLVARLVVFHRTPY
jgi:hypothetical protein